MRTLLTALTALAVLLLTAGCVTTPRNGYGTFSGGGIKYEGEFKNGVFHGRGSYIVTKESKGIVGTTLTGEFRNGAVHGYATQKVPGGYSYVGQWENNKMHGYGTGKGPSDSQGVGKSYTGEWKMGKASGRGTLTFPNGAVYVGEFRDNKRHGQGTLTLVSGTVKEGVWENNVFKYARKGSHKTYAEKTPTPSSDAARKENENLKRENERLKRQKKSEPKVAQEKEQPSSRTDSDKIISASSGSGFAVSADGHVITNNHVINGCNKVKIYHNGLSVPAQVITYDPQNDLALLKGNFRPKAVFSLSNHNPQLLQDIYVAGYPFGRKVSTSVKVTKGIISSLTGMGNNFSNIQIDAALQPGNSGGPILNDRGNIVGVAVAKLDLKKTLKDYGVIPENTNFGIKTSVVKSLLESSGVSLPNPHTKTISKSKLGKLISDGTYYLSCWMTTAQIEKMRSKKVIFQSLD